MKKILLTLLLCLFTVTAHAQTSKLAGNWQGQIDGIRRQINFKLHFTQKEDSLAGTIEIQGVNLPLKKVNFIQPDSIFISFRAGPASIAKFKGSFQADTLIKGTYYQRGYSMPFKLSQIEEEMNNQLPLPYNHKNLIIHNDSIKIGGTLTWRGDQPTKQLVITISGSGAQNRNEEIYGFKVFGTIADYLTRHGIAVFRYDDRGVGKSTGNIANATLEELASDVEAIMSYFSQKQDSIPAFSNIILLGHSQGGIIAGKVTAENKKVDKLILMSSSGVPLSKLLIFQTHYLLKNKLTDDQLKAEVTTRKQILEALKTGKGLKRAKKQYQKKLHTQLLKRIRAVKDSVNAKQIKLLARKRTNRLIYQYRALQNMSLLFYNPTIDLQQLKIPVLVLFGGKDIQVPVELNKEQIKQALEKANVPYKIKIFPNANHLYQKAKTGLPSEYATLKDEFVNDFLETITRWIKK